MNIKHLVLSGGGPVGLVEYGILKDLSKKKIIKYENIKSIYATSIGGFMALIYILNFKWEWMDDYLIKRPWEKLINITSQDYINLFYNKGLLDKTFIIETIKPLLLAKDLNIDITLQELYNITKIDLHIFTCNLNKFCKVDLNYKTYPELKLWEALLMTAGIPILLQPLYYKQEYYLDGGIFATSPLNDCYQAEKCDKSEILAIINDKRNPIDLDNAFYKTNDDDNGEELKEDTNILNFFIYLLKTTVNKISFIENENSIIIDNIINVATHYYTIDIKYWNYVFSNSEERDYLIKLGIKQSEKFIEKNNINIMELEIKQIINELIDKVINTNITDIKNNQSIYQSFIGLC